MTSTHIRIPKEVKSRLDNLAKPDEPLGRVISRLIDYYESVGSVNTEVNTPVNLYPACVTSVVNSVLTEDDKTAIWQQITEMQDREKVTVDDMDRFDEKISALAHQVEEIAVRLSTVEGNACHDIKEEPSVNPEVIPENDKVHLDDDTRRVCIQKVNDLKEADMGIMKIAELLGMKSHSQLSKLMNPVSYPKIGLTRHQIDTLLSL